MGRSRLVAAIWMAAAALAGVIIVLFRGDAPGQAALTTVLAVAGAGVAVWLLVQSVIGGDRRIHRLGRRVAGHVIPRWRLSQSGSLAALVTDAFLAAAGAAAAGLSSWTGRPRHRR